MYTVRFGLLFAAALLSSVVAQFKCGETPVAICGESGHHTQQSVMACVREMRPRCIIIMLDSDPWSLSRQSMGLLHMIGCLAHC